MTPAPSPGPHFLPLSSSAPRLAASSLPSVSGLCLSVSPSPLGSSLLPLPSPITEPGATPLGVLILSALSPPRGPTLAGLIWEPLAGCSHVTTGAPGPGRALSAHNAHPQLPSVSGATRTSIGGSAWTRTPSVTSVLVPTTAGRAGGGGPSAHLQLRNLSPRKGWKQAGTGASRVHQPESGCSPLAVSASRGHPPPSYSLTPERSPRDARSGLMSAVRLGSQRWTVALPGSSRAHRACRPCEAGDGDPRARRTAGCRRGATGRAAAAVRVCFPEEGVRAASKPIRS